MRKSILFVCTGNICRSPLAEGFFNHLAEREDLQFRARSAGLNVVLDEATREAILAAREYSVDISEHRSRQLNETMVNESDLVLAMTRSQIRSMARTFPFARDRTFLLNEYSGGTEDIMDPYGHSLEVYRECARQIWDAVRKALERL